MSDKFNPFHAEERQMFHANRFRVHNDKEKQTLRSESLGLFHADLEFDVPVVEIHGGFSRADVDFASVGGASWVPGTRFNEDGSRAD